MDDDRVWAFEASLWKADPQHYHDAIDPAVRMALPTPPFLFAGEEAVEAVAATPRWSNVAFEDGTIARPQDGLIVVAYTVHAQRDGHEDYVAHCTSTYRKAESGAWQVVQHQQTPKLVSA
jgi:hypothetical protein